MSAITATLPSTITPTTRLLNDTAGSSQLYCIGKFSHLSTLTVSTEKGQWLLDKNDDWTPTLMDVPRS